MITESSFDRACRNFMAVDGDLKEASNDLQSLSAGGPGPGFTVPQALALVSQLSAISKFIASFGTPGAIREGNNINSQSNAAQASSYISIMCWNGDEGKYDYPYDEHFPINGKFVYSYGGEIGHQTILTLATLVASYGGSMANVESAQDGSGNYIFGDADWGVMQGLFDVGTSLAGFEGRTPDHPVQYYVVPNHA